MKRRKKAALWISGAVLGAAAIAIPLAIIYGRRGGEAQGQIQPKAYEGSLSYESKIIAYGSGLPADFLPNTLPDATNAEFYAIDLTKTAYEVIRNANDKQEPKTGQALSDLNSVSSYGAGMQIKASFTFLPKPDFPSLTQPVVVTRILEITKAAASAPDAANRTFQSVSGIYGAGFVEPTTPAVTGSGFIGYKLAGKEANFKQVPSEAGAVPSASSQGASLQAADWTASNTYWVGTVVSVSWNYELDENNYEAEENSFSIAQDYEIVAKQAGAKPQTNPYANRTVDYGIGIAGPEPVAISVDGYEAEPYVTNASVEAQSQLSDQFSPRKGTEITDWNATRKFNSGTVIKITYKYRTIAPNYTGPDITFDQNITIVEVSVDVKQDVFHDQSDPAEYTQNSDPAVLLQKSRPDSAAYESRGAVWYQNHPPQPGTTSSDFLEIRNLSKGATFVVRVSYVLKPNYKPVSSSRTGYQEYFFYKVV